MKDTYWHSCSKGEIVIFRDSKDFNHFINQIAIGQHLFEISVLGYSIMSTHFHLFLKTNNEAQLNEFLGFIRRNYCIHFKRRYSQSISPEVFNISSKATEDFDIKRRQLSYVYRNPLGHMIVDSPLLYEFCSARYIFWEEMNSESAKSMIINGLKPVSKITSRLYRSMFSFNKVPDNWLIDTNEECVWPCSFLATEEAKATWNNKIRLFINDLHKYYKPIDGDSAKYSSGIDELSEGDKISLRCNRYSDIDVCKIIDEYSLERGYKSFTFLTHQDKDFLVRMLMTKYVPREQIKRCLWLDE